MEENQRAKWIDDFFEIIGWFQIMMSPTLVGLALGGLTYFYSPDTIGIILGSIISIIGFTLGIIWATRIKKKRGAIWFISRIMATPNLDARNKSTKEVSDKIDGDKSVSNKS